MNETTAFLMLVRLLSICDEINLRIDGECNAVSVSVRKHEGDNSYGMRVMIPQCQLDAARIPDDFAKDELERMFFELGNPIPTR